MTMNKHNCLKKNYRRTTGSKAATQNTFRYHWPDLDWMD